MANNVIDRFMASLQATPLIKSLQQTGGVNQLQNMISGYAAANPVQTGNFLDVTGGSLGNMVQRAPVTVAPSLAALLQPAAKSAVQSVVKAITPVRAAAKVTPVKKTFQIAQTPARVTPVGKPIVATTSKQPPQMTDTTRPGTQLSGDSLYKSLVDKSKAANADYYAQILEESNWNIDEAKRRLEEDYRSGIRLARESSDVATRQLFNQEIPEEQLQTADALNRRGLLSTPTGTAQQVTGTLSTGEKITAANPYLRQSYGGLGGGQIAKMQTAQQARAEAFGRALKNKEEELTTPFNRSMSDQERLRKQRESEIRQQENEAAATLGGAEYANRQARIGTILGTAYSS